MGDKTWDDRKWDFNHAILRAEVTGDTAGLWAVVDEMQSRIDELGGQLLNAQEARQMSDTNRAEQSILVLKLRQRLDALEEMALNMNQDASEQEISNEWAEGVSHAVVELKEVLDA